MPPATARMRGKRKRLGAEEAEQYAAFHHRQATRSTCQLSTANVRLGSDAPLGHHPGSGLLHLIWTASDKRTFRTGAEGGKRLCALVDGCKPKALRLGRPDRGCSMKICAAVVRVLVSAVPMCVSAAPISDHGAARAIPGLQKMADQGNPNAKCALLQLYVTGQALPRRQDDLAALHHLCANMGYESQGRAPPPALSVHPLNGPQTPK